MNKTEKFIEELKTIFKERLRSILVYGSKAETKELDCNVNLIIITDFIDGYDIKKAQKASLKFMGTRLFDKYKNPTPIFMGEKEWLNSQDTYAIEYADIKERGRILYGKNVISLISVKKDDLRLQCELEIKNLLMRLRSAYLRHGDNSINSIAARIVKSANIIFKTILRIKEITPSISEEENIDKVSDFINIDKTFWNKALCTKNKKCNFSKKEAPNIANNAIIQLNKILEHVNNL